ncbi:MAG: hypothetical protein CO128_09290 [Ignavibacteriales bacterium CG_4_9_14_3_um_filter_30_11]|nr:MAG: hypothetical protein CO128_09290 [Ignavibacteriales bacterium CG_4_9_14_3_um_filter_30_11]
MNFLTKQAKIITLSVFILNIGVLAQQKFVVNLNDKTDDTFKVTVFPKNLTDENDIFQFASTAPETYQIMDIGRFVKTFDAFDVDGDKMVFTVKHDEKEIDFTLNLQPAIIKHLFTVESNPTSEQLKPHEAWLKNL